MKESLRPNDPYRANKSNFSKKYYKGTLPAFFCHRLDRREAKILLLAKNYINAVKSGDAQVAAHYLYDLKNIDGKAKKRDAGA